MRPLLLFAIAALAGCAETPTPTTVATRDSAGVRIVDHGSFEGLPVRLVSPGLEVGIGTGLGDPAQQLDGVLAGAVLPDGRIALLDNGSAQIRFYGADGALTASQGRRGEGPGEYAYPSAMFVGAGDSLVVWDATLNRATVVAPDAASARVVTPDGDLGLPLLYGVFPTGELLIGDRSLDFQPGRIANPESGRDFLYSPEGRRLADLGPRSGGLIVLFAGGKPIGTEAPRMDRSLEIHEAGFSTRTQRAVWGDGFWLGTQEKRELSYHDRTGAVRTVVRWQGPSLEVAAADREAFVENLIADAPDENARAALRSADVETFGFASSFPTHAMLVAGADGTLWMADYPRPQESGGPWSWTVLGPDGIARSRVGLPPGSTLLWASGDRVLIRMQDTLGVERVELRSLTDAEPTGP